MVGICTFASTECISAEYLVFANCMVQDAKIECAALLQDQLKMLRLSGVRWEP